MRAGQRLSILAVAFAFCGSMLLGLTATAIAPTGANYNNNFFRNADTNPTANIVGSVGSTQWVKKASLQVGIYFTSNSGSVTIQDYSYCSGGGQFDDGYGGGGKKGRRITQYYFSRSGTGTDSSGFFYGTKGENCGKDKTFTFKNIPFDRGTGKYIVTLVISAMTNWKTDGDVQNTLRLTSSTSGAIIAHLGGGNGFDGSEVTVQEMGKKPKNTDYVVPFGSDCSIDPGPQDRVAIKFYDLDNRSGSAQGSGSDFKRITVQLVAFDRNSNTGTGVALYDGPDAKAKRLTAGAPFPPSNAQDTSQKIWFTPSVNKRYELRVNDVYYNNTIQYGTPFDGYYYNAPCPWSAKPTSVVRVNSAIKASVASATPADKIDWVHTITSNGKHVTASDVDYRVYRKVDSGAQFLVSSATWTQNKLPGTKKNITSGPLTAAQKASYAGHTVCERLWINPSGYDPPLQGAVYSAWQCVKIDNAPGAPAATTTAYVDGSAATYAHPGQSITFTHEITSGVAYAIDGVVGAGSSPDSTWRGVWDATTSDSQLDLGRPTTFHKGPGTTPYSNDSSAFVPTNADVGKQVCRQVEATHTVAGVTTRITSAGACVTIVPSPVSPTVQFWGYDARIGGVATTTSMIKDSKTYGSWSEYGAMMNGTNTGDLFASGAAYENGVTTAPSLSDKSALSFANTGAGNPSTGNWNGPIGFDGSYASLCPALSQTAINGISNATSTQVICNTGGTIEIKDDITLDSSVKATSNVPQILIIAKNIKIDSGVKRIDAWLIAGAPSDFDINSTDTDGGAINTCSEDATLNADGTFKAFGDISDASWQDGTDACKNPLIVNGPVMANKVYFNRTTDPTAAGAGEVFNLRGDAFLWAFGGGGGMNGKGVAQTVSVKELPPRF